MQTESFDMRRDLVPEALAQRRDQRAWQSGSRQLT